MVPLMVGLSLPVLSSGTNTESPKSATLAFIFLSSSMLHDFTSLWIMGGSALSCKYAKPRAAPRATRSLLSQSKV
jgi:hypothetical protein